MFDKSGLKEHLLAIESQQIADSRHAYDQFVAESNVDGTEPRDDDEVSRAVSRGELAQAIEQSLHAYGAAIELITNTDFARKSSVESGAAVKMSGSWYVFAVATQAFEHLGERVMGISTRSPLFNASMGLQEGDNFELNGRTWLIEEIA